MRKCISFVHRHPRKVLILTVWISLLGSLWLFAGMSAGFQPLNARLNRIAGYSSGKDIQGDFRIIVEGPENLTQITIYFNNTKVYTTTEYKFSWAFDTGEYSFGEYNISVQGWDNQYNLYQWSIIRNFVAPSVNDPYWVLLVGIGVSIGVIGLIAYKKQKKEANVPPPTKNDVDIKLDKDLI